MAAAKKPEKTQEPETLWFRGYLEVVPGSAEHQHLVSQGLTPDAGPPEPFDEIPDEITAIGVVDDDEGDEL